MEYLLISEIADKSRIAENTCRRYAKVFPQFFRSKKYGPAKKYHPDAVALVQKIFDWYNSHKLTTEEIRERLREEIPVVIDAKDTHHITTTAPVPALLQQMAESMVALTEMVNTLREENKELSKKIGQLEEQVKASGDTVVGVVREEVAEVKQWAVVQFAEKKKSGIFAGLARWLGWD